MITKMERAFVSKVVGINKCDYFFDITTDPSIEPWFLILVRPASVVFTPFIITKGDDGYRLTNHWVNKIVNIDMKFTDDDRPIIQKAIRQYVERF